MKCASVEFDTTFGNKCTQVPQLNVSDVKRVLLLLYLRYGYKGTLRASLYTLRHLQRTQQKFPKDRLPQDLIHGPLILGYECDFDIAFSIL